MDDTGLWPVSTHVQYFPIIVVSAVYGTGSHCASCLWEISHAPTTVIISGLAETLSTPSAVFKDLFLTW